MEPSGLGKYSAADSTPRFSRRWADRGAAGCWRVWNLRPLMGRVSTLRWLRLRSASGSGRAAPKPLCRGPVGTRWFPVCSGSPHPAAQPWTGLRLSLLRGVAWSGCSFTQSRGGPCARRGSSPEPAVGGRWRHSCDGRRWLAGGQRAGNDRLH